MKRNLSVHRPVRALLALGLAFVCASAASADDTDLFSANVPPNVMLMVDNSRLFIDPELSTRNDTTAGLTGR